MEARGALTTLTQRLIPATHSVHIGRRRSDVGDITLEVGHGNNLAHLLENRTLRARVDKLTLVRRDGAERAAAEAATMNVYRVLNHLPRRDITLTAIARMWRALIGKVERVVELLGGERLVWRRDDHIVIARALDERGVALHHIAQRLNLGKVLGELTLVGPTLLKRAKHLGATVIQSLDVGLIGSESHLTQSAQQLHIKAITQSLSDLTDYLIAHTIDQ